MPLLLDTQVVIWLQSDSFKLPRNTLEIILSEPKLYLSKVCVWEIAIKFKIGKLDLDQPVEKFVQSFLSSYKAQVLDISLSYIYQTQLLPLHHRDPFDRLLIAQAVVEQIAIVSSDKLFDQYGVNRLF